jgi:hypothetical protein
VSGKIAEIDAQTRDKETARTEVGRDKKKIGELGKAPDEVEHPTSIDDIKAEREKTRKYQMIYGEAQGVAKEKVQRALSFAYTFEELENIIPLLKNEVKGGRDKLVGFKAYTKADVAALDKQIAEWYDTEEKAKKWDAYCERKRELERLAEQYETLTHEIEALRESRKKTLAGITLIKGLEIREDNFLYYKGTLRGITETNKEDNWSTAESVQVFFSIGASFSGKMKVLVVDNAESLDDVTTGIISKWAEKSSFLVILLKVANVPEELEEGIIYVKEGEILAKPEAGHGK